MTIYRPLVTSVSDILSCIHDTRVSIKVMDVNSLHYDLSTPFCVPNLQSLIDQTSQLY